MIYDIKKTIEDIPIQNFYTSGRVAVDLEAYAEEGTYIIQIWIEGLRDAYSGPDCLEHIREMDLWKTDQDWIKEYFLEHLEDIEIMEK